MRRFLRQHNPNLASSQASTSNTPQPPTSSPTNALVPFTTPSEVTGDTEYVSFDNDTFSNMQANRTYPASFDSTITSAGRSQLSEFPNVPPPNIPDAIAMTPEKRNHISMNLGFVQYNLRSGVQKGETTNCYGDDFCQVHGITRIFVVDIANHLIALCTPHRYMAYIANQTFLPREKRFKGNLFQFGGAAVATPRWAMRAAAWNILKGQSGEILRSGDSVSITGSRMKDGQPQPVQVLFDYVPYSGMSWVIMDKWMEDARSHKISIVAADTGLTELCHKFESIRTLPLVLREDECDLVMADPVFGLVEQDDRFYKLRATGQVNKNTKALQFRGGWYAPFNPSGVTCVMRLLKFHENKNAPKAEDGTGPWKKPERAYSDEFVRPPSKNLWLIGGVDNIDKSACARKLGTHLEMEVRLAQGSGGFNALADW